MSIQNTYYLGFDTMYHKEYLNLLHAWNYRKTKQFKELLESYKGKVHIYPTAYETKKGDAKKTAYDKHYYVLRIYTRMDIL